MGVSVEGAAVVRCPNCGELAERAALFGRADLSACAACGGWRWEGALESAPEELYGEAYFEGGEYASYAAATESHRRNFRAKLEILRRCGVAPGAGVALLELGCATGEFMAMAREQGIERAIGLEASAYAGARARSRGLDVRAPGDPGVEGIVRALRPNLLVAWDVWEHLPDPAATFERLLRAAAEDVVVALTTVDASSLVARLRGPRWRQFHPPTHLNFPTRRSLASFFERRGFTVRAHRSFGYYRPLQEYLRAVRLPAGGGGRWASWPVYLNLYDTQLVVAARGRAHACGS